MIGQFVIIYSAAILDLIYGAVSIIDRGKDKD